MTHLLIVPPAGPAWSLRLQAGRRLWMLGRHARFVDSPVTVCHWVIPFPFHFYLSSASAAVSDDAYKDSTEWDLNIGFHLSGHRRNQGRLTWG